jgi:ferredoxin
MEIPRGGSGFLPRSSFGDLVHALRRKGYTVIAPSRLDGVVTLQPIEGATEIASGLRDQQKPGSYRLVEGDKDLCFEYVVGPDSPKRFLFPSRHRLFQFHVEAGTFMLDAGPPQVPKLAFVGIRPCEIAAIKVQDRAFGVDESGAPRCVSEPFYAETRRLALFVAVNCTRPGGNCFCLSMGTGPQATEGHDLALTELRGGFVLAVGSARGAELARELPVREATSTEVELAEFKLDAAREHMGRRLQVDGLARALDEAVESPLWNDVARRCLSCGNCTLVCPTCFCSTVTESTTFLDDKIDRRREWESCFTHQFSYTTAGPVRNTIRGRYRHWVRHKLCTWWDQFGLSGCVGCGRCITWCPSGIDITEEAARICQAGTSTEAPVAKEVTS